MASKKPLKPTHPNSRRKNAGSPLLPTAKTGEPAPFPVVGLGASAGGLAALEQFFSALPPSSGMAFVVVTHQLAGRPSLMAQLLGRKTAMPVVDVVDVTRVAPNHVYLPPPGHDLAILDGVLHPMEVLAVGPLHLPIDYFFRTLAQDQKEHAIAIVLSGTGTDGTLGIKEIKAQLGLVLVQDDKSAQYGGMPKSALATGLADYVLSPPEMPERLLAYAKAFLPTRRLHATDSESVPETFHQVVVLLRARTGHDFSHYKMGTLSRRIERRMNVHRLESVKEYIRFLQENPTELDLLFRELLIGVTSFFRDPEAFDALKVVFSELLAGKPDDYVVRGWIGGCSSGEEAYSVAILMREVMHQAKRSLSVQLFATDLDAEALAIARAGVYPAGIANDVSPARLSRFFTLSDDHYRVTKDVRDMIVFAPQNVIADPPFTKLDVLTCRNLLIYLDRRLHNKLIPLFHYTLRPGGVLFLGSSESVGAFGELFDTIDKKWKVFRRRDVASGAFALPFPAPLPNSDPVDTPRPGNVAMRTDINITQLTQRILLRDLVPPTVLVHEHGEVVLVHGRTGLFLEPAPGPQAHADIFTMAREGLELELAAGMRAAAVERVEVLRRGVRVKTNGDFTTIDLRIRRLSEPEALRGLFLISFERPLAGKNEESGDASTNGGAPLAPDRIMDLEREIQHAKERHQSTIEELETTNEELKSTNEELQSTNEELQSTNEELETSKEEMQSLNEELQTVNGELQGKVDELSRANDDMKNLLNATDIATVFLDSELRIKRYTEQAKSIIPLIPTDVGRSIGDLGSKLHYDRLVDDAQDVLRTLAFREREVRGERGVWYLMRILPYRTTDNVIDGLVMTFVDITKIKTLQENQLRLLTTLANSATTVFGQDRQMRFVWMCGSVFGRSPEELFGKTDAEVFGVEPIREFTAIKRSVLDTGAPIRLRAHLRLADRERTYDFYVEPVRSAAGEVDGVSCVVTDVTSFI